MFKFNKNSTLSVLQRSETLACHSRPYGLLLLFLDSSPIFGFFRAANVGLDAGSPSAF